MENTSDKMRTVSEAAESLHIEVKEAISILERTVNLSNLDGNSEISNWAFRVLEGMVQTKRAKDKEEMMSKLKDLSKESTKFPPPPSENAMCYCPAPRERYKPDDALGKGNGVIRKVLIITAIVLAMAILVATAFVIL